MTIVYKIIIIQVAYQKEIAMLSFNKSQKSTLKLSGLYAQQKKKRLLVIMILSQMHSILSFSNRMHLTYILPMNGNILKMVAATDMSTN